MNNTFFELGQAAVMQQQFDKAAEHFARALEQSPKDAQIMACLGQSHCWQGNKAQGLEYLRQSGQILLKKAKKTRDTKLVLDLVEQLQHWGDYVGASDLCKLAVQVNPQQPLGLQLLALCHSRLNQNALAVQAAKQALKLVPGNATLIILLASMELGNGQAESACQRLQQVLTDPLLTSEQRFRAHKELARGLDKLKQFDQVFQHLHAAGEVGQRLPEVQRVDKKLVPQMLEQHVQQFDAELLGRWRHQRFPEELPAPIFVVGFMRTGTTLTQEVLGAHPEVLIADETDLIMETAAKLKQLCPSQPTQAQQLRALSDQQVLELRRYYWQRARALFGQQLDGKRLLDKTTMNSIDLGFIASVFPDAKLVFLIRDPRDVCLSCLMQTMTPTPSTVHLLTWQETAQFYHQVMSWWEALKPRLPMAYRELRYEDAVFDFEHTFKTLFEFLELSWNPEVVHFHRHAAKRYIASPSFGQVAQPLYASSVGRWRHFQNEFPAIESWLQPFIKTYGYEQ